jgi:hypothetical protein
VFEYPNPHRATLFARPLRFATDLSCLKLQYQYTINGRANFEHMVKRSSLEGQGVVAWSLSSNHLRVALRDLGRFLPKSCPKMELKKMIWIM